MLLAFDIGNTNIKVGVFNDSCENMICSFAISSATIRTSDEYYLLIKQMLSDYSVFDKLNASVISSVVPSITESISNAVFKICNRKPFVIGSGTRTGFPIKIDVQAQLGADIVSNTAAAFLCRKPPFVVVDLGTATTVTAVDSSGCLVGTSIIPGATVSLNALNSSAALLSDTTLNTPVSIIGKNSHDSICSGVYYSNVFAIDGFINALTKELCKNGEKLAVIGTGGLSEVILPACRDDFLVAKDLTLKGAAHLFYCNISNRHS
ncbi:MAG: type III pantothenate kinase [Clostridia bacterium]|nr:type III pantothenate kinase [Clostridia bacterium]